MGDRRDFSSEPWKRLSEGPLKALVRAFEQHLERERGLSRGTIDHYLHQVRLFLLDRCSDDQSTIQDLQAKEVTQFILHYAREHTPITAKHMVTALRSFLRFARRTGLIAADLADCVPTVPGWRLATLPKGLQRGQVEDVLKSCDPKTAVGRRDHAILLLLARLGLRALEVVSLTLEDINWAAGEITILGKGPQRAKLPLPRDVGEALVAYLRDGRPQGPSRRVFLRAQIPYEGFASSSTIGSIVRKSLARAGLSPPRKGAHLFRHALAMEMLQRQASLEEIGQILRHHSVNATAVYAKVDLDALRTVAQPWPGGVK
ncbi:tyrosine-type recombinase/integrase [bacterium]|nr:tyrosine-type recombinase/integrase [bacterium]